MDLPLIFHRFPTDPPAEGPPGQRRADAAAALVAPSGAVPGKAAAWCGVCGGSPWIYGGLIWEGTIKKYEIMTKYGGKTPLIKKPRFLLIRG